MNFKQLAYNIDFNDRNLSFTIKPKSTKKTFSFKLEDKDNFEKWVGSLKETLEFAENLNLSANNVSSFNHFWKYSLISERDFLARAQTGDILLFRSVKHHNRTIKMVRFDHIALVVRYANNQIILFESSPIHVFFTLFGLTI